MAASVTPTLAEFDELVAVEDLSGLVDAYARMASSTKPWMSTESEYVTVLAALSATSRAELIARLARYSDSNNRVDLHTKHRVRSLATLLHAAEKTHDLDAHLPLLQEVAATWVWYPTEPLQAVLEAFRAVGRPVPPQVIATGRRSAIAGWNAGQFKAFMDTWSDPLLNVGEPWAERASKDLRGLGNEWRELVYHCRTATAAKPTAKWEKRARELFAATGPDTRERLIGWLELVPLPRTDDQALDYGYHVEGTLDPYNADIIRGMMWILGFLGDDVQSARVLSGLVNTMLKKIPGVGPRAPKIANAAVLALSRMEGEHSLGQLARLSSSVKFKGTLNQINTAMEAKATALGVTRDEIEEMAVPAYGLTEVGRQVVPLGDCRAEITVDTEAALSWFNESGKQTKAPPAAVKRDHPDRIKELKAGVKDVNKMMTAQIERLDRQFLLRRQWRGDVWRQRYAAHPLLATLTRRLLWRVDDRVCGYADGRWRDLSDACVDIPDSARIQLWHPIGEEVASIVAWREWLERHQIRQPFKQAHREVYLLTAAEENTGTYSNRFAAHILRQHQFHALAAARGWRNRLRLMVDDSYEPPYKELPAWGLRAEFWVEGIGDDYGADTTDSGSYLRLVTDQVRFYRAEAEANYGHASGGGYGRYRGGGGEADEPIPLSQIPPLVLSEVLRDVDLFVGVASVGNDPTWSDGGPEGRYRDYWHSYSFGELGQTAQTRKELLSRLIPRLAIRDRAEVDGRFLVVRGDIRTYKIHLGSGNILMEPNDQYLCIVAGQFKGGRGDTGFLPFEGDGTLAVILSKALLLAKDTAITDSTITSQLGR
ncbi:uncharacterized protein DUF4132 [Stackebrandtia endophytica]|uniref:Uncharacterized protein DUF4132 n=1 Tax=Stackebrandtia endophytica TaxID=1496996 RepID=A0A543B1A2_9ACTN|nr:DUF4132 domain-containing protein [Stackebrandtia endophytica]TQL78612.1 uncharacterized protein DUF4132 [Stackebrandtia endophytica]